MSPVDRRKVLILLTLMLIGALFESVGLGMLLPLIGLMASPDVVMGNQFILYLINIFNIQGAETLFFVVLCMFVLLFVISLAYRLWLSWVQTTFMNGLKFSVSTRLFRAYLNQPWIFYLNNHSSALVHNITREVDLLTQYGFSGLINFLREVLLIVTLLIMLMYLTPIPALVSVCFLAPLAWLLQRLSRIRVNRWADVRQREETLRLQIAQETFSIVRDIKLLGKEHVFLSMFSAQSERLMHIERAQSFMRQISRPIFELSGIIGITIAIVVMWATGTAFDEMAPKLALFAVAVLKILPSMNQALVQLHGVRYVNPVVNLISEEIQGEKLVEPTKVERISFKNSIELLNVEYLYQGRVKPILKNISLYIPFGSFVAFVGPTGAGKSTLIDLIVGLLGPSKGDILVDGVSIFSNVRGWQSQIGYVGQSIIFIDETLRRNIALGIADADIEDERIWRALEVAQVSEFVNNLPEKLDTIIGENGAKLSGGERQRIGIARALYQNPKVLILDEATSALDELNQKLVMEAVEQLKGNTTIIMITHRMSTLQNCNQIFYLNTGGIIEQNTP